MVKNIGKKYILNRLELAGIQANGDRPWDIQIKDERFFEKVFYQHTLGIGEAYMMGWFDCHNLDECFTRMIQSKLYINYSSHLIHAFYKGLSFFYNRQNKSRALNVAKQHYDLSNTLFECMLDQRMTYSCAYWKNAETLDEAQEAKLDLICKKLAIQSGMRVLDVGCGWGSFSKFAAEKYGAEVVGITISEKQQELAQLRCQDLPVEIRLQDYRDINEKFDRIVSVGQMEHVGLKNYRKYFEIMHRSLNDDGLFLLHTIGNNNSIHACDPWIDKYIFPNGMLPSAKQMTTASESLFIMEDWHNFGADYDKTLMAWVKKFESNWDEIKHNYDESFYRMWRYYLLTSAAAFRARDIQLWQIVYSKRGVPGGYQRIG